jgi:hypothetical protein
LDFGWKLKASMTLTVNMLRANFVAKRISSLSALSAGELFNKLSKPEHIGYVIVHFFLAFPRIVFAGCLFDTP